MGEGLATGPGHLSARKIWEALRDVYKVRPPSIKKHLLACTLHHSYLRRARKISEDGVGDPSGYNHLLILKMNGGLLPQGILVPTTHAQRLTTSCNYHFKGANALFWLLWVPTSVCHGTHTEGDTQK